MSRSRAWIFVVLVCAACVGGCGGGYVLRGKVVPGPQPGVSVVSANDPRMESLGLSGAELLLMLDPDSLGREELGSYASTTDGWFEIPVDVLGAGFLEHEFGLVVRHGGYQTLERTFRLPSNDRQLLIILRSGRDTYQEPVDPLEELRRYGGQQ